MGKSSDSDRPVKLSPLFTWRSAICDSDLEPGARHVALVLSMHMSERGESCFPSRETLMRETGLSRDTVRRHIKTLWEGGWIIKEQGGGRFSNRYTAQIPGGAYDKPAGGLEEAGTGLTVSPEDVIEDVHGERPPEGEQSLAVLPSKELTAQDLTAFYVDLARERGTDPPRQTVGAIARNVGALVREGIAPERIKAGIERMFDRGIVQPALLPQFIAEAEIAPRPKTRSTKEHVTAEAMAERARQLAEEGR